MHKSWCILQQSSKIFISYLYSQNTERILEGCALTVPEPKRVPPPDDFGRGEEREALVSPDDLPAIGSRFFFE